MAKHENNKPHVCDRCGKAYVRKALLNQHVKHAHEDKEVTRKLYQCPHCEKSFRHKISVERHIEAFHVAEKRWQCDKCAYAASTKGEYAILGCIW